MKTERLCGWMGVDRHKKKPTQQSDNQNVGTIPRNHGDQMKWKCQEQEIMNKFRHQ